MFLSVYPSSSELDRVIDCKPEVGHSPRGCHLPKTKRSSELRSQGVRVSWSPQIPPPSLPSLSVPSARGVRADSSGVSESKDSESENNRPCRENGGRLMNGPDRPVMTGSNNSGSSESRNWLADVAATAAATSPQGAPDTQRLHEPPNVLQNTGSLFRPPITLPSSDYSAPSSTFYSQYPLHTAYYSSSQSASTPSHLSSLNPYPYYPLQFPAGYQPSHVLQRPYPPVESYSTVLASMGSHPRSAFLPSQFSSLSPSTTSQNPAAFQAGPRALNPNFNQSVNFQYPPSVDLVADKRSPKESDRSLRQRMTSTSPPRCEVGGRLPSVSSKSANKSPSPTTVPAAAATTSKSAHLPIPKDVCKIELCREQPYRVPSGKEGSMKHRILTRPPDIHIEHSAFSELSLSDAPMSAHSEDHPSPKRSKPVASPAATSASMPSTPLRPNAPAWRTPSPWVVSGAPSSSAQSGPTQLHYPAHFMKGSIIQLASGDLKSVEELRTEDFVNSAELSGDLKIDSSTVVRIEENLEAGTCMLSFSVGEQRVQVTVEAALEHPFFVFGQGWSSCLPERTFQRYSLSCQKLQVGDVCISLTHRDVPSGGRTSSSAAAAAATTTTTTTEKMAPPTLSFGPTPLVNETPVSAAPAAAPPQTHSIETQTSIHSIPETLPALPGQTAGANPAPALIQPRKRRWSAPGKISDEESASRTKLS